MESYAREGLTFDVSDHGPGDGRLVIALHGFPEDRHCWDPLAATLGAAGVRTLAPDQRGYSPGARPAGRRAYRTEELAADVVALADAAGTEQFDLIGHDWGAVVAWHLAGQRPDRVRSLTALSVPHPAAVLRAMGRSSQALHSWYMAFFQLPRLPELALGVGGGARMARMLTETGLDPASAERYARRAAAGQMTGPINWYRALPLAARGRQGPVRVPTLFVWGEGDRFVTRASAEACERFVTGPFRFVALPGASHWLPTQAAGEIGPLLVDHLTTSSPGG